MNTKHTPGPWKLETHTFRDHVGALGIFGADASMIVPATYGETIAQSDANARLMSAAPRMADAIRAAANDATVMGGPEYSGNVMIPRALYDELENALNAATGEYEAVDTRYRLGVGGASHYPGDVPTTRK